MTIGRTYNNQHAWSYICDKCDDFNLKNEPSNTKIDHLIKWSIIMHI